jgi:hypothetical protein
MKREKENRLEIRAQLSQSLFFKTKYFKIAKNKFSKGKN